MGPSRNKCAGTMIKLGFAAVSAQRHMLMLSIHNATRKREGERIPSNQKPTETSIQCSQVATSAQQWELTTTITQDDNNPGMSLQQSQ
jgi:hypothetical protein